MRALFLNNAQMIHRSFLRFIGLNLNKISFDLFLY